MKSPDIQIQRLHNPTLADARSIFPCNDAAWKPENGNNIYPYYAFNDLGSWSPGGEIWEAIQQGKLHVVIARNKQGDIVGHGALAKKSDVYPEAGRFFVLQSGGGIGTALTREALLIAQEQKASQVDVKRSDNRTPMGVATRRAAAQLGFPVSILGFNPLIYHEYDGRHTYDWGEVENGVHIRSGRVLDSILPPRFKDAANIVMEGNQASLQYVQGKKGNGRSQDIAHARRDGPNLLVHLLDAELLKQVHDQGYMPLGLVGTPNEGWFLRVRKPPGELPFVINESHAVLRPGISSIYCSDQTEYEIISKLHTNALRRI